MGPAGARRDQMVKFFQGYGEGCGQGKGVSVTRRATKKYPNRPCPPVRAAGFIWPLIWADVGRGGSESWPRQMCGHHLFVKWSFQQHPPLPETDQHFVAGHSAVSDSLWPHGLQPAKLPVHGIPRQEYWSGLSVPSAGDLPNPGTESACPLCPALAGGLFITGTTWEALLPPYYNLFPSTSKRW